MCEILPRGFYPLRPCSLPYRITCNVQMCSYATQLRHVRELEEGICRTNESHGGKSDFSAGRPRAEIPRGLHSPRACVHLCGLFLPGEKPVIYRFRAGCCTFEYVAPPRVEGETPQSAERAARRRKEGIQMTHMPREHTRPLICLIATAAPLDCNRGKYDRSNERANAKTPLES